uniref:schlafen family member 11-like n=1 Tax=Euleptes europaea TaxID=460621 RepID=UPI00253FC069|nr:schlafen family member 11-like [Euleptes europaea]
MAIPESQLCLDLETGYAEVIISVGKVTFGEHQRKEKLPEEKQRIVIGEIENEIPPVKAKKGAVKGKKKGDQQKKLEKERESEVLKLARAACALLNSGGGVIRASIANQGFYCIEDGLGQDIQGAFQECIHSKELSEYFDFIPQDQHLMIWVKAWSSSNSSKPRICNVKTGLYQRNGESTMKLKDLTFLKEKLAYAKCAPEDKMSPKRPRLQDNVKGSTGVAVEMADGIWKAAVQFFERDCLKYGEILGFAEWTMVEFKAFPKEDNSLDFVRNRLQRYASAFANTQGGYLIFGVDNLQKVVGCKRNINPTQVKEVVATTIDSMPCFHLSASKPKVDYEFKAQAVHDEHGEGHGYVFVVKIKSFHGIVFSEEPDSWTVEADHLKRFEIAEWVQMMTVVDPDLSKLAEQFTMELSLSDGPPMIKPVYSVQGLDSLDVLRRKLFPESDRVTFIPQPLCEKLFSEHPGLKALLEREIQPSARGTLMFSRSWAVDIGLPKNRAIVCDALLMAVGHYPVLYTIVENPTSDVCEHSRRTARLLKQKLVNVGGYAQKICVVPKILNLQIANAQNAENQGLQYPRAYGLRQEHLPRLQKALVTVLLGFTSFLSDFIGVEFLNLLTLEQYEYLSTKLDETRDHFIYGIPGSGKTVVALKIIEKIKNEFDCQLHEILYICENKPLRDFVGQKGYHAVTRAVFMKDNYPNIKHIVVDEAQNFRVEHGQWYKKACNIVRRDLNTPGIFWIFLDYFQMSHPFNSGLPLPSQQYPQECLTKGVRNASAIYEVVRSEMEKIVEAKRLNIPYPRLEKLLGRACCGNSVVGRCRSKPQMEVREIVRYVARECQIYLDKGYSRRDIAILCSTKEKASYYRPFLVEEMRKLRLDVCFVQANELLRDEIVLDSARRFAGLERTIVFGINPVPTQQEVSHNLLLCVASRANQQLHVLYEKEVL